MSTVQELVEKLRKTMADNLRVRIAILLVILAIIGWQFLPAWVRLAIVMYTGWPIVGAVVLGAGVGWLTWNWKYSLVTGGAALACLLILSAIAIDAGGGRCTGYVQYGLYKIAVAVAGSEQDKRDYAYDADFIFKYQLCFTLAEFRASWR